MTVPEIEERVAEIARLAVTDNEAAHAEEDQLYEDVLRTIADSDDSGLAKSMLAVAALKTRSLDFARWYA